MANKKFWPAMLITALVFGTAIIGCDTGTTSNGTPGGSAGGSNDITYTVEADGKADEVTSTELTFSFSKAVSDLGVGDIKIYDTDTGAAKINTSKPIKEILTGGETSWTLSVTINTAGKIRVSIDKDGIERGRKTVIVHQNTAPNLTKDDAITLTGNQWQAGSIYAEETKWYKFDAENGVDYLVQWDDSSHRFGDYTAWLRVTAYESDGETNIPAINGAYDGYSMPRTVSGVSGTVYLKVQNYSSDLSGGTYAIRFYDPASMPQVFIRPASARATIIPYVAVKWNAIPLSDEDSDAAKASVTGFRVYRSNTEKGNYIQIGEDFITDFNPGGGYNDAEKVIYYDKNVTAGNTYWYKVAAYNSTGEGELSDSIESEAVPAPTPEPQPLTIETEKTGNPTESGQVDWYKFEAVNGKTYKVQWQSLMDNHLGFAQGNYAYINVSVFTDDEELVNCLESYADGSLSGYTTPATVSGVSGPVYIRVENRGQGGTWIYTIKVYEVND